MILYYENTKIMTIALKENDEFINYNKLYVSDELGMKFLTGELKMMNYIIKNDELIHLETQKTITESKRIIGEPYNFNLFEITYNLENYGYIIDKNITFINKSEIYIVDKFNPFYCLEIIKESNPFNYDLKNILLLSKIKNLTYYANPLPIV